MEYWLAWFHETNRGHDVKAIALAAEDMGFSGVALSDHVALPLAQHSRHPLRGIPYDPRVPNIEPITTAATMAAVTTNLRFMTYAYVMGMREPFSVAKHAAALADLSDNRFALGLTPGWSTDEIALLGQNPATRGERFTEALDVIQGLWREPLFSYHGKHYRFDEVGIAPRPAQPPPILIGGHSRPAIRRAAAHAGWIGMNHSVTELRPLLAQLDELSDGRALKYVVASEPLTDHYLGQLQQLGVTGLVLMPWDMTDPASQPLDRKLAAMRELAAFWH